MTRRASTRGSGSSGPPPGPAARRRAQVAVQNRWVRVRVYIAASVMAAALVAIGVKAYALQVERTDYYRELARRQHMRTLKIPAPRGVVYDSRGRELAATARADSIFASPPKVQDVTGTAEALAQILPIGQRELENRLASPRQFVWLDRHVTPEVARAIERANLPGIELTGEPRRFYPGRELAGPVIGFANIDGVGLEGVERTMNDLLEGTQGELAALRDARGRVALADADAGEIPGASVYLTLDRSIQSVAERELAAAVTEHQARAGVAVVLEVETGRVLAMASSPTYDPNQPASATKRGARNRAITDAYEMGSSMKVFAFGAALEAGAIEPDQVFDVEKGRIRIGRHWIRDSYRDEELDVTGCIRRSSNVCAIKVVQALGAEGLHEALHRYGFARETGVELPGERSGRIRPHESWREIGLATAAFGMGMTVTPLQVAAGFAAVANDGIYNEPRIVLAVRDGAGKAIYRHRPAGRRVMDAEVARTLTKMTGSVFDKGRHGGTARSVDLVGYTAGGKTGTAHKLDPETGRYADDLYLSTFVGVAPLEEPKIAVLVLIDEPGGEDYYGGVVAGPAFARIATETLRYLGVPEDLPEDDEEEADEPAPDAPEPEPEPAAAEAPDPDLLTDALGGVEMPDFRGLSMAEVLRRAHEQGIEVEVVGTGRAASQTPKPGVPAKAARCRVVFQPGY